MKRIRQFVQVLLLLSGLASTLFAQANIKSYSVTLSIDIPSKSVIGKEVIAFYRKKENDTLVLSANNLTIDSVLIANQRLNYITLYNTLKIFLPEQAQKEDTLTLCRIYYKCKRSNGLHISNDEVFTGFHTASWLPCDDRPGSKSTYQLTVSFPKTFAVVASGELMDSKRDSDMIKYQYKQSIPISTYTFGFAAGLFKETSHQHGKVILKYLTKGFSDEEIKKIFTSTDSILDYLENITGIPYPYPTYSQVLTRAENEQEASGFAMLSADYGKEVLADPKENWLIIHELVHQWFGNAITCATWSDFWLNEAMTTFITASCKEHFVGREEYDRDMELSRMRYKKIMGSKMDRAIVSNEWKTPEDMSGVITYYKGALVLNYLRFQLGEDLFWKGIKEYAGQYWNKSVTTHDFESVMEKASGKDLHTFFNQWVYNMKCPALQASYSIDRDNITVTLNQAIDIAFMLPMRIAIQTAGNRKTYDIILDKKKQEYIFQIADTVLSVRIDVGGNLPIEVSYDRPLSMLLYQMRNEPDIFGRIDAMNEIFSSRHSLSKVEYFLVVQALYELITTDPSRLVRSTAQRLYDKESVK
jgi:aminopeptidase N